MQCSDAGMMVQAVWNDLPNRFPGVQTDAFITMPNHVHSVVVLPVQATLAPPASNQFSTRTYSLDDVVRVFKSLSARHVNQLLNRSGTLWQRNYFEHIIRDADSLYRIRKYCG